MSRGMILVGMGIGAGLMFALDPQQGNRRRALARDKVVKAVHSTGRAVGATSRDVAHRASGLAASFHARFFEDNAPDDVVEARVRARLGRIASHARAIEVSARGGQITLGGAIPAGEMRDVVRAVSSVRGVERVENQMRPTGGVADAALDSRDWAPATQVAVAIGGVAVAAAGLARRDRLGMLVGGIGLAVMGRAVVSAAWGLMRDATMERGLAETESAKNSDTSVPVKIVPKRDDESRGPDWPGGAPTRIH